MFDRIELKHKESVSKDTFSFKIPDMPVLPQKTGLVIMGGLTVIGLGMGAAIGTQMFFGAVMLAGFVAITETNKYVKYVVTSSNKVVDLIIFGGSIYAMTVLGVTIAGSLTFAGLGYTLLYAPYLRRRVELKH